MSEQAFEIAKRTVNEINGCIERKTVLPRDAETLLWGVMLTVSKMEEKTPGRTMGKAGRYVLACHDKLAASNQKAREVAA